MQCHSPSHENSLLQQIYSSYSAVTDVLQQIYSSYSAVADVLQQIYSSYSVVTGVLQQIYSSYSAVTDVHRCGCKCMCLKYMYKCSLERAKPLYSPLFTVLNVVY